MRRFSVVLFLLIYSASVSGASFTVHFCGNKLQKISLAGLGHKGCCCKKAAMKKNCCKDKVVSLKLDHIHKQAETTGTPVAFGKTIPAGQLFFFHNAANYSSQVISLRYHSPPVRAGSAGLLVLNSIFRI